MIYQRDFPMRGSIWNPDAPIDRSGFVLRLPGELPTPVRVAVVGTVRDQLVPASRTWKVWQQQKPVDGVEAEFWMLDDGSSDGTESAAARWAFEDPRLRYAKFREPGGPDRSCTLLLNWAIRNLDADLLIIHWWDRIPNGFDHLRKLVTPLVDGTETALGAPLVSSAQSRHIGGSSSVDELAPEDLAARLRLVPWESDPASLSRIAGVAGGHTVPGSATESSEFCVRRSDLLALGGYDERYVTRHGYPNVDLWRRLLHAGFVGAFPTGLANFHQSHPAGGPRTGKDTSLLSDLRLVRNVGIEWGALGPMMIL